MKEAILVVSFGTTFEDTREKNITAVLNRVAAAHPDCPVYEAWTSSMIMRALEKRGQHVDNVPEALAKMHADGITDIKVLPTHLLYGDEYDKMRAFLDADAENSPPSPWPHRCWPGTMTCRPSSLPWPRVWRRRRMRRWSLWATARPISATPFMRPWTTTPRPRA